MELIHSSSLHYYKSVAACLLLLLLCLHLLSSQSPPLSNPLIPFRQKATQRPSGVLFERVSHEVAVHHLIPEGMAPPCTLPLLKLNTSSRQMAALHLRPPTHPRLGVTFFSFYTSLHWASLYNYPLEEKKEEKEGGGPDSTTHLVEVFLFECLSSCISRLIQAKLSVCVCVCECYCSYLV